MICVFDHEELEPCIQREAIESLQERDRLSSWFEALE
jgi:hypothetical protein